LGSVIRIFFGLFSENIAGHDFFDLFDALLVSGTTFTLADGAKSARDI
jgi:hypothetical protein